MYKNIKEKITTLLAKDIQKDEHEEILLNMKKKLEKLHGKDDEESQEEIFIIKKTIQKLEIKIDNTHK